MFLWILRGVEVGFKRHAVGREDYSQDTLCVRVLFKLMMIMKLMIELERVCRMSKERMSCVLGWVSLLVKAGFSVGRQDIRLKTWQIWSEELTAGVHFYHLKADDQLQGATTPHFICHLVGLPMDLNWNFSSCQMAQDPVLKDCQLCMGAHILLIRQSARHLSYHFCHLAKSSFECNVGKFSAIAFSKNVGQNVIACSDLVCVVTWQKCLQLGI